jgi:ABC-type nitrate/sulfonate/bicarbonate transport system substrate-binding protein
MKEQRFVWPIVAIAVVCLVAAAWFIRKYTAPSGRQTESITVGMYPGDASLLIALADTRGFFKSNGLNVTLKEYESGYKALGHLNRGEVDIATVSEYPFVTSSFDHENLRIVASIASIDSTEIVARKDRCITEPSDLRGKRIGVYPGTILDFFIRSFLTFHHMTPEEVTLVDLATTQAVDSISSGQVDAVISWDLYLYAIKKQLGENAVSWPAQNGQDYYWLLVCLRDKIDARPEVIVKFLRAMVQAEDFVKTSKQEAQALLINRWRREPEYVDYVWQRMEFSTSLPQGLLTAMEDEAKEQFEAKKSETRAIPNYLRFIYLDGLQSVKPKGITIFK